MKKIGIIIIFFTALSLIFLALNFLINDDVYLNNNKPLYKIKEKEEYKLNTVINKRYSLYLPKGLINRKNSFYLDLYNDDINIKLFYSHNFILSEHIKQYKNFKTKGVITYKKLQVFSYIDEKDKIHAYLIKNNLVMEVISDKYSFNFNVMKSFIDYKEENVKFEKLELKDNHLTGYINYKNLKLKLNLESDYHEKEVVGLDNVIRLEKDNKRIVIKILDKINEENYEKYKEFYR